MLRFRLLGPFEAFRDEERIPASDFRTRQARCALKLLISEHDRPVPFARLADTFWPDADPVTARNSLQVAVRTLRRVLEPELDRGSASRFIVTTGEAYRFLPNDAVIDVAAFVGHRRAGLDAERRGSARAAIESYRAAMATYRGEYIAEEPDAEWVLGTRERLREAFVDVADRLAGLLAAEGSATDAVAVIERALVADRLRDELYLRLMTIHARAGRRGHALAAFDRCSRIQRAEIGAEPGPALARLRSEILSGTAPLAALSAGDGDGLTPASVFVGRERELATLFEAWNRSRSEAGHTVFITGDAGIGKTRLAQHFAERVGPEGQVVWLGAQESEADVALAPLLLSCANWLDGGATTRQLERLGAHGPALAHQLPQVRQIWPDCPPAVAAPGPVQLFEALIATMFVRTGRGRGILVLDDAHWADRETLRWFGYALQRAPPGMLVLFVARPGEGRAAELDRLRADAGRRDRLLQIELGPLTVTDVEQLVEEATERAPRARELARRLHAATKGNPLFVVETIRDLSRLAIDDGETVPIPDTVRDAIVARIEALPGSARDVLGALALVGAAGSARLVASVAGRQIEDVIDALDVLLARRLVRIRDDASTYGIEHPFVTHVVCETMGPARREEMLRHLDRGARTSA